MQTTTYPDNIKDKTVHDSMTDEQAWLQRYNDRPSSGMNVKWLISSINFLYVPNSRIFPFLKPTKPATTDEESSTESDRHPQHILSSSLPRSPLQDEGDERGVSPASSLPPRAPSPTVIGSSRNRRKNEMPFVINHTEV